MHRQESRRWFLRSLPPLVGGLLTPAPGGLAAQVLRAAGQEAGHPDPRPGIDASRVLRAEQLHSKDAAPVFDLVRQIPAIADGIRCQCECKRLEGYRSLLSCFEGDGMAQHCEVCQGQARLAYRMYRLRRTLDQIRDAIDKAYA